MPELLHNRALNATTIENRYVEHAAHQSMTVYLDDWERAYARLGNQIEALRGIRDARKKATEQGDWPPTSLPAESKVVDLMDQLERSVRAAREARDAR